MKKVYIILVMIILSGCGATSFEKSMDKGREALRQGDFQKAMEAFDNALIEEPTNKDALLLMERAKQGDLNQKRKLFLANNMYEQLNEYAARLNTDANNVSFEEAKVIVVKLQPLIDEVESLCIDWQDDEILSHASTNLLLAAKSLFQAYQSLSEGVVEPLVIEETGSKYDVFRAKLSSNDSVIRAQLAMIEYEGQMRSYLDQMNELKKKVK